MWTVNVFESNEWHSADKAEVFVRPTIDALLESSKRAFPNAVALLHRHLESEQDLESSQTIRGIGRQPIAEWANAAEEESRDWDWSTGTEVVALDGEALGLYRPDRKSTKPTVIAWHEPTAVIIRVPSGTTELLIEYIPEAETDDRLARLRYRYATPQHVLETVFDWRGYFGSNTAIIDGWSEMRGNGRGFVTKLRAISGYVIGRTLRRLTLGGPTMERDPLFKARQRGAATRYPEAAKAFPLLGEGDDLAVDHAMVFVHGTASCGLQGLKDLFDASHMPGYPVRRFEHDTFRSLEENADELALLIQRTIKVRDMLLVAHSRGGLVARIAMDALAKTGYPENVELHTFGTPHLGTPLVAVGTRLLSQLYKIGEWGSGLTYPVLSPLTWAHSFLFDGPVLPPGIAVMGENDSVLNMLNRYGDPTAVTCWGSTFAANSPGSGFGIEVEGILRGAMHDVPNDLVVPTSSAVAFGAPQPLLCCSHLQYFVQPDVRRRLHGFSAIANVATLAERSASPLPTPDKIDKAKLVEERIKKMREQLPKKSNPT